MHLTFNTDPDDDGRPWWIDVLGIIAALLLTALAWYGANA